MAERKLAYANTPGVVHLESAWVKSRTVVYGEPIAQAEAEIKKMIESKSVIVVEEKG